MKAPLNISWRTWFKLTVVTAVFVPSAIIGLPGLIGTIVAMILLGSCLDENSHIKRIRTTKPNE